MPWFRSRNGFPRARGRWANEKKFTKPGDARGAARRDPPWFKVDKTYTFDTPQGRKMLGELFGGRSQLVIYHFMLGPGWVQGCPTSSFLADHFDRACVHLAT